VTNLPARRARLRRACARLVPLTAALFLLVSFAARPAGGAGYLQPGPGARAMSLGGAFTGVADDPSAVFWNPAGLARLERPEIYAGVVPTLTKVEFAGVAPFPGYEVFERWRENVVFPPHLYASMPLRPGLVAGLGFHAPVWFESGWQSPESFSGRFLTTDASIRSFQLAPCIGARVRSSLYAGAGLSLAWSDMDFSRRVPFHTFEEGQPIVADLATMEFDGEGTAHVGFQLGLLYGTSADRVGLAYRHRVKATIDGTASFVPAKNPGAETDSVLAAFVPTSRAGSTEIVVPGSLTLGGMIRLAEYWRIAVDLQWTDWSAVEELALDLDDPALSSTTPLDYHDAVAARAGLAFEASDKLEVRAGYAFEDSPSPNATVNPVLPDAARHLATIGFGYRHERWKLDVFEGFVIARERSVRHGESRFDGDYDQRGWTFGVSVGHATR